MSLSAHKRPKLTPEGRKMRAKIAANARWAKEPDRRAATTAATLAFLDRFAKEVDPEGVLPPEERAKRAENARKAYFQRLALKSARARQARNEAAE